MSTPSSYKADYYYNKIGAQGKGGRTQISGQVSGHLQGGTTENAVLQYLRNKHPGHEITLMKLEWK